MIKAKSGTDDLTHALGKETQSNKNIFSFTDHALVRAAIASVLTKKEVKIVLLRYWQNYLTHEIALELKMPILDIETSLKFACFKIKKFCLSHAEFSRKEMRKYY